MLGKQRNKRSMCFPSEMNSHWLEIVLLPSLPVIGLSIWDVGVHQRDVAMVSVISKRDYNLRIFIAIRKISRSPRLNNFLSGNQLEVLSGNVSVPCDEVTPHFLAAIGRPTCHFSVRVAVEPRVVENEGRNMKHGFDFECLHGLELGA